MGCRFGRTPSPTSLVAGQLRAHYTSFSMPQLSLLYLYVHWEPPQGYTPDSTWRMGRGARPKLWDRVLVLQQLTNLIQVIHP